jgi:hypothetical protein
MDTGQVFAFPDTVATRHHGRPVAGHAAAR